MSMYPSDFLLLAAPSQAWSWFVVLCGFLLGLAVALSPNRRTYEVKKPKED